MGLSLLRKRRISVNGNNTTATTTLLNTTWLLLLQIRHGHPLTVPVKVQSVILCVISADGHRGKNAMLAFKLFLFSV